METTVETQGTEEELEIRDPKAVLEALDRAKADAKKYREQFEALEKANADLENQIATLSSDEKLTALKGQIIELKAKQKLEKQGLDDADRIFSLMDASAFDLDDEGNVLGFDDNLKSLKTKLPELFDTRKRVAGGADAYEGKPVKQNLSSTEAQVKRIFGH